MARYRREHREKTTNLWHSELRRMTRDDPVEVFFKTNVLESNYPNKPDYVVVVIDDTTYSLNIENEEIGRQLDGLKGQTLLVVAEGELENATVELESEDGQKPERAQRQERSSRPQGRPREQKRQGPKELTPEEKAEISRKALVEIRKELARCNVAYAQVFAAVDVLVELRNQTGRPMTESQYQGICSTYFIRTLDSGKISLLDYHQDLIDGQLPPQSKKKRASRRKPKTTPSPEETKQEPPPDDQG